MKMKKLLALVLALVMVVGLLPTMALADPSEQTLEAGGVTITYNGTSAGSSAQIGTFTDGSLSYMYSGNVYLASLPYGAEITAIDCTLSSGMTNYFGSGDMCLMYYNDGPALEKIQEELIYDEEFTDAQFIADHTFSYDGYGDLYSWITFTEDLPTEDVKGFVVYDADFATWSGDGGSLVFIQISTAGGDTPTPAVVTSALDAQIARVWDVSTEEYTGNFYTENDRYNGKDKLAKDVNNPTRGFWYELTKDGGPLKTVLATTYSTQAAVDADCATLKAAIDKLIPSDTQANTTLLYEATEAYKNLNNDDKTYTDASWNNFVTARNAAQTMMDGMFDVSGEPNTANNKPGNQKAIEDAAAALTAAYDDLFPVSLSSESDLWKSAASWLLGKSGLAQGDYTVATWDAWSDAYGALLAANGKDVTLYTDYETWTRAIVNATAAYNGLTSAAESITVHVRVADSFGALYPEYALSDEATASYDADVPLAGEHSIDALLTAMAFDRTPKTAIPYGDDSKPGQQDCLMVYINGTLAVSRGDITTSYWQGVVYNGGSKIQSVADIQLHENDDVVIIRAQAPYYTYYGASIPNAPYPSYYKSAALLDIQSSSDVIEAEAGSAFSLSVTRKAGAAENSNTGVKPAYGASLFLSDKQENQAAAKGAAAITPTDAVADSSGSASLTLYVEGWYKVFAADVRSATAGASAQGTGISAGNYPNLAGGDYVLVHVVKASDDAAVRAELQAELDEVYQAYEEGFYTAEQWTTVNTAYQTASETIRTSELLGDAYNAQKAAVETITALQEEISAQNDVVNRRMSSLLMLLPTQAEIDADLFTQGDAARMTEAIAFYAAMTDYQRAQLTSAQSAQWTALQDAWGDDGSALPPAGQLAFTVNVVGGYGAQLNSNINNFFTADYNYYQSDGKYYKANELKDTPNHLEETVTFTRIAPVEAWSLSIYYLPDAPFEVYKVTCEGVDESNVEYRFTKGDDWNSLQVIQSDLLKNVITRPAVRGNVTITIYTRSTGDLDSVRSAALAELTATYQGYDRTRYTDANWATLTAAYNDGLAKIRAAETTAKVGEEKKDAIDAMDAVEKKSATDYGSVTVSVENSTWTTANGAPWTGTLVEKTVNLTANSTMMSCIVEALDGYTVVGAEDNYISSINNIAEFDGGVGAGWMGSINDWFVNEGFGNFTVANGKLSDGDVICVMYTCEFGADIRAGVEGNTDTTLYSLSLTGGTLTPGFDPQVTEYVFALDSGVSTSTVSFSNNNRSFQSRAYRNNYVPTAANWVRSGDTVGVAGGDVLYIGVGEKAWPSMGQADATKYQIQIVAPDDAGSVETLIDAIGSVTYSNYKDKLSAVASARAAYDNLTAAAKAEVGNYDKLTAAEEAIVGFEAVDAFKAELAAFPSDMTKATKAELQALVDDYEALKENKSLLTVAETSKVERAKAALEGIIQGETDAEKLAAAKTVIEAADFTVAQATANDAAALKTFAEGVIATLDYDEDIAAVVTVSDVTPAVEGTAEDADGTDGKYTVSVTLTLNSSSATATVTDAAITATAYVAPVPTITWQEALEGVQAYVAEQVPNPGVGSTKGEWAVFALNRGGVAEADWNNKYIGSLQTYVDNCSGKLHDKKYTEYSRVVIALTSLGYDATKFTTASAVYDLVSPLLDKQDNGAYWAEWQGNNGTAFALLALDSHGYLMNDEGKAARAAFIASLKANQMESGAWSISGDAADLDVTAAAVYALAPYYLDSSKLTALGGAVSYDEVKTMVDNALTFLSGKQNTQGGFGSPEADVWTIIALTTLGRDPETETAFVKDGGTLIDDLLRYYDETTGGFKHEADSSVNQMSSEQAAYGLVAYSRFKAGKTALYDMSDVEIAPNVPETPEEADRAAAAAVDELIDAIGTVTLESESAITAARTAYDALTAAQKALVTKYATLTVAETKLTALKNKDNKPDKDKDKTITVTMRLIGAEKATKDVNLGADSYLPNYVTWIPTTSYTLEKGSSVYDLWTVATADYGIRSVGAENNYVETVYAPSGYALSEFTNGPRSGWMYTINGRHPGFGLCEQELYDGDIVIWHYVNDYSYEVEDWFKDDPNYPALGDGTYWNLWLKANDTTGGTGGGMAGGEKKDKKETGDGSYTTTSTQNVTADDGSQVTVETEKTVETKENDDGSVTETVTETTKTTVVSSDGKKTVTETVAEAQTVRKSEEFADGSVTETESTVEKVTETVTAADGTKQTTVTETEETKKVNTTTADGKTSGTGTYSAKTTVTGADGKKTTAVTEGTVAVSTDDKGTVSEVTNAKTTTTAPDGTKTETVTVITEAEMANGTTGKVVADEQGNTISAEATVSEAALEAAQNGDGVIEIPVTVNPDSGATVRIHLPELAAGKHAWVEIGTTETGSGNVAYLKLGDVTKLLSTCKTGSVIVPVTGDCEVIVKDNSKAFSDVDAAAWYGDSVKFVTAREIFNGNGDGTFAPSATMNRAMAAQILYNLDGSAKAGDGTRFSDVTAGDWFNGAVGWASGLGVITGYNGAYAPLDAVTRQDLVTILYRYAKQAGYDVSVGATVNLLTYADGADVKDYAQEAMRWAIAVGLVKGYEDNTLRPTATATRAEVATIMQRLVQNAVK